MASRKHASRRGTVSSARPAHTSPHAPHAPQQPAHGTSTRIDPADPADDVRSLVPRVLRVAAALGWRLLVVAGAVYVVGVVVSYLAAVIVPVAVALLLAALLSPPSTGSRYAACRGASRPRW
jgi:putative heme transporter